MKPRRKPRLLRQRRPFRAQWRRHWVRYDTLLGVPCYRRRKDVARRRWVWLRGAWRTARERVR
jgi:hypothetical protein